jgi:hypothetical protein
MWGQHGGRKRRKPNFVICNQMPYRCAISPMSHPGRKARDTVAPTSVECAWAFGPEGGKASHRSLRACIDTSTPTSLPCETPVFRCPAPGILATTAPVAMTSAPHAEGRQFVPGLVMALACPLGAPLADANPCKSNDILRGTPYKMEKPQRDSKGFHKGRKSFEMGTRTICK